MECQLMLIVTDKCNLHCTYCYEYKKNVNVMKIEKAKKIIETYLNSLYYDTVDILFFGGEPLLEFGLIVDICEWIWNGKWKNKYI